MLDVARTLLCENLQLLRLRKGSLKMQSHDVLSDIRNVLFGGRLADSERSKATTLDDFSKYLERPERPLPTAREERTISEDRTNADDRSLSDDLATQSASGRSESAQAAKDAQLEQKDADTETQNPSKDGTSQSDFRRNDNDSTLKEARESTASTQRSADEGMASQSSETASSTGEATSYSDETLAADAAASEDAEQERTASDNAGAPQEADASSVSDAALEANLGQPFTGSTASAEETITNSSATTDAGTMSVGQALAATASDGTGTPILTPPTLETEVTPAPLQQSLSPTPGQSALLEAAGPAAGQTSGLPVDPQTGQKAAQALPSSAVQTDALAQAASIGTLETPSVNQTAAASSSGQSAETTLTNQLLASQSVQVDDTSIQSPQAPTSQTTTATGRPLATPPLSTQPEQPGQTSTPIVSQVSPQAGQLEDALSSPTQMRQAETTALGARDTGMRASSAEPLAPIDDTALDTSSQFTTTSRPSVNGQAREPSPLLQMAQQQPGIQHTLAAGQIAPIHVQQTLQQRLAPQTATRDMMAVDPALSSRMGGDGLTSSMNADGFGSTQQTTSGGQTITARAVTPPPVPVRVDTIAMRITSAMQAGQRQFEIMLDPPELGRIDVRLEISSDGQVRALLMAERPETLDLLQRDSRMLERTLQTQGLKLDDGSLQFSLKDQGSQGQDRASDRQEQQARNGGALTEDETLPDAPLPHQRIALPGQLNLVL